ncbi:hypothetical protein KDA_19080 [Dictyobacter alpinus]|uniref:Lipid/polyisoprenoid-binding YceI-like domain-containing protein n=1 Tax=Dictyobacter alpinus TaxID=2014873 RepID=A0A402B502_9CHLR|nr:YceI family protein [Dictyobacter alpinus]GCE26424.1 hypothetical protein KDA_19080 [Dictyobacter alpinus]
MSWEIDRFHSVAEFAVQHLGIATVRGKFTDVSGTIEMDPHDPERSSVRAQIAVNSIDTSAPQRDAHLRTADFFEVVKYPTITFNSTQIRHVDTNRFIIAGDLSLHGVTRQVQLRTIYNGAAQDHLTNAWRFGLRAITKIDRRDYGMTYKVTNNAGMALAGTEIQIELGVEAIWTG